MLQIHPNARTTPVTRAEIARSGEPTGVLARRYGVSTETIRKWRKRGASDCRDGSVAKFGTSRASPRRPASQAAIWNRSATKAA
jgi:transposase-like protein